MKIITESFFDKLELTLRAELPFVAYRHPKATEINGVFQKNADLNYSKDFSDSGFVFVPFDANNPAILFPLSDSEIFNSTFSDTGITENSKKYEKFKIPSGNAKSSHIALVQKGIDFLNNRGIKKVVLSRKEIIDHPHLEIVETFKKLLVNYTNAMVYVWFHPKVGLWLGATPETLLKVDNDMFTIMALAGTQSFQGSLDVVWKEKERQEQQYVTDFILDNLTDSFNITNVSEPHTIKAGSLIHLCTNISGRLSNQFSLTELLKSLHPTPAVCGLPKTLAKEFILENEGYDREFYTGFLGELNINKTSSLFVNLRCMQVLHKQLAIYIGGGITLDSHPVKEWEETVAKSKVMLKVLS